ncbi:MAG: exopolysaccharide biosynthesis polyprenyl glycosylphosphotransferase [Rubrobacter sp.]|nr:exopolysaccharide biosynthesis polyprenyl glycosylphosphotransferase [Rubrobacter sp.]
MTEKILGGGFLRRSLSVAALLALDAVSLALGLLVALYLAGDGPVAGAVGVLPVPVALGLAVFGALDLYDRASRRRSPGALIGGLLLWAGLVSAGSVLYPQSGYSPGVALTALPIALAASGGLRLLYEQGIELVYRRGLGLVPTVVVGPPEGRARLRRLVEEPGAYSLAGEVGISPSGVDLEELRGVLDCSGAEHVVLTGAERLSDESFLELLRSLRLRGVRLRVVPGAVHLTRGRAVLSSGMGLPLLEVDYPSLDNTQRALKRALDVAGSLAALAALSPLLLAVALAVRLDSRGPVFFRQTRAGADGKAFLCYKFRSMHPDAEERQEDLEERNEADGAAFKIRDDPRVTLVGRSIRRWSIDELPQLLNVLAGDMSLVGPRPLPLRDFERLGELQTRRLAAVPGITGYWQTSGRSDLSFEDMVRLDLYYIENWSLSLDLKIILKTVGAVLNRKGAY